MLSITLELISQLQWVIAQTLLGDSFSGHEAKDLWAALCDGDLTEIESMQADIQCQWEQANLDDLNYYRYQD